MQPLVMNIAEIALRVRDLPQMASFYETMLGLQIEISGPGRVFYRVGELNSGLGGAGHPQMLVLYDRGFQLDTEHTTFDHLAFEIPGERYAAELQRFKDLGLVISERIWPECLDWQARSFFFHDPEGNIIELIAHNPVTQP